MSVRSLIVVGMGNPDVEVRRIGTVGGDTLFGIPLDELARAYEGGS